MWRKRDGLTYVIAIDIDIGRCVERDGMIVNIASINNHLTIAIVSPIDILC